MGDFKNNGRELRPAGDPDVILIAATTTSAGLLVHSEIDPKPYPSGVKVSDKELSEINIHRDRFHGDWN